MSTKTQLDTPLEVLVQKVRACARYNTQWQAPPAAILWTDKEAQWQNAMPIIKTYLPELVELGDYQPEQRIGPAVWVKCAIAYKVADLPTDKIPIIYLPGVARKELRAIEQCPDELKPLAELQYRGFWWATPNNNRDWTVSGFLSNQTVGLNLDIAKDAKTQVALLNVLPFLLQERTSSLVGRRLQAKELNNLVADDPVRDILLWMNEPHLLSEWEPTLREIFVHYCSDHFGLTPGINTPAEGAKALCERQGEWGSVWQRFKHMAHRLPHLIERLKAVRPQGLALEPSQYLSVNLDDEQSLLGQLKALAGLPEAELRGQLANLWAQHAIRSEWLWNELGLSPYLNILEALCDVADRTSSVFSGPDAITMAKAYQDDHWLADGAAINAMALAVDDSQRQVVADVLAIIYTPWLARVAENFQRLVQQFGYPGSGDPRVGEARASYQASSQVVFFVDGLRFDIAQKLVTRLQLKGTMRLKLHSHWAALPSLTATAKAAITPVHDLLDGDLDNSDFVPRVSEAKQAFSSHYLKKLLAERGWQYLEGLETGDPSGLAWVQTGDLDHAGHDEQLRLPSRIDNILNEIEVRLEGLLAAGWQHIRIVTDHGWLWVPDKLPKAELPKDATTKRFSRCAILKSNVATERLSQPWFWNKSVRVAMAPGISGFIAGDYYNHGGLSLQECLAPVINVYAHTDGNGTEGH